MLQFLTIMMIIVTIISLQEKKGQFFCSFILLSLFIANVAIVG